MGNGEEGEEGVLVDLREFRIARDRLYAALEVLLRDRTEGLELKTGRFELTSTQSLDLT